jgi:DNA-binding Xre family transcriptional regulator
MKRIIRRSSRTLTPAELADWKQRAQRIDAEEKDAIIARGRAIRDSRRRAIARLSQALQLLRDERERQGLSLSDLQERTGIDRGALSRLENAKDPNPTVATLQRYAAALGKELVLNLVDAE